MKVFAAQSDCCDLRAGAWQAPLSMGFLREASWSRLPFPAPGDLPEPGIKPRSPVFHVVSCIAGRFCTNWASWEAQNFLVVSQKYSYFLAVVWGGFRNGMRLLWFFFPTIVYHGWESQQKKIYLWLKQTLFHVSEHFLGISVRPWGHLFAFSSVQTSCPPQNLLLQTKLSKWTK